MFIGFSRERGLLRLKVGPNSEGLSIHAPKSLQEALGYSVEKLAGMKLEDLVDPASHADLKAVLENVAGSAEAVPPKRVNWLLRTKSARTVQVEGVLSIQIHKRKKGIVAILEDVSWREELSDAQMRIEAVSAHWTDGVLVVNERQEVIVANEAFCRMFSLSSAPEKLRGLPLQKLGENVASSLLNTPLLSAQQPASLTMQTGSGITIQVEATPISAGARDLGRLLCFRDKTSQLKADEKLLPLIEHFRSSVPDSARCGIAVLSPDGRFLAVSEALCTFFGYSREELLRMSEERLITHSNGVATAKPADNRTPLRKSYRRRDGSSATARVQVTDWCNDQGATIYSLMSLDDSGERHAPPKPAVWDPKVATGAWCPEAIEPHLPWLKNGFVYQDNYAQAAEAGIAGWALAGATRRGRLHAQHATHREDAFRWETGENFTIACVSDGAGSCRYSRIGSETVCREVTRLLREALNAAKPQFATADLEELTKIVAGAMGKSVWQACMSLRDLATKAQCEPKDFRCTLLLVVHYKSSAGTKILGSQIGDGLIEALMRDGSTRRYGTADSGEFAGQVSCFIPDDNAVTKAGMIFQIPPDELQALLICTDGIDDAFFPIEKLAGSVFRQYYFGTQQKLPGFEDQKTHGPILGSATDTAALQAWLDFEKRGENDDRTVLVLHRQPPEPHPPTIAAE